MKERQIQQFSTEKYTASNDNNSNLLKEQSGLDIQELQEIKTLVGEVSGAVIHLKESIEASGIPPTLQKLISNNPESEDVIMKYRNDLNDFPPVFLDGKNSLYMDVLYIWVDIYPGLAMEYFKRYKNEQYANGVLEKVIKEKSPLVMKYFKVYKNEKYAKKVLEKAVREAAQKEPRAVLAYFKVYKDEEYAKEVLEISVREAAEKDPRTALTYFEVYKDEEYAKEVLEQVGQKDPGTALRYFEKYKDEEYAKEVLEKAVREVAQKDPGTALRYFEKYKDEEYAKEVLEKAVREVVQKDPGTALTYLEVYKDEEYAKEVLEQVGQKDPGTALTYFNVYKNEKYAKEVLEKVVREAAEKDPGTALRYFEKYKNEKYAKEVLEKAAEKNPGIVLDSFKIYKDEEYGEEVLESAVREAAEKDPGAALAYFKVYKNEKYVKEVLEKAAEKNPGIVLNSFKIYKNEEYGKEVLEKAVREAVEKDPGAALTYFEVYKNEKYAKEVVDSIDLLELFFIRCQMPRHEYFDIYKEMFHDVLNNLNEVSLGERKLSLRAYNANIYSGILKTYQNNKASYLDKNGDINREKVKKDYEGNINKFLQQGKEWSSENKNIHATLIRASDSTGDDRNGALSYSNDRLASRYKKLGTKSCTQYVSDSNSSSPDDILSGFKDNIASYPNDHHIIHIGGHGEIDGSLDLVGGTWTQAHFDQLFNIQAKYPERVKIDITSCNSGMKDEDFSDNRIHNLSMDSGRQPSYGLEGGSDDVFLDAFEKKDDNGDYEADFDGDGIVNFNEALLYRAIHYNKSLTPISMDYKGEKIDISHVEDPLDDLLTSTT